MIKRRFPNIYEFCLGHGLDMTTDWIPVAPAAHYMMGGVKTDLKGETAVKRLFLPVERYPLRVCTGRTVWPATPCRKQLCSGAGLYKPSLRWSRRRRSLHQGICRPFRTEAARHRKAAETAKADAQICRGYTDGRRIKKKYGRIKKRQETFFPLPAV